MKVDKVVSVEKSPVDLLEQVAKLVAAVKASGGFTASAIPADIGAIVAAFPAIIADVGGMSGDLAEDKVAFIKAVVIGAEELAEAVLAK